MAPRMISNGVTFTSHTICNPRVQFNSFSHHEKSGFRIMLTEHVQHVRR